MADRPRRLHLLVEGQTEETIVREVLSPYLTRHDMWVTVSILVTKRPAGRAWHHGGVTSWPKMLGDIRRLLADTSLDVLTTLVDYYALPGDVPGMGSRPVADPRARVEHVEAAMAVAVGDTRFVPHLTLHEVEAWVFAAGEQLADLSGDPSLAKALHDEVRSAGGPEEIDDGPETAPSKRLLRLYPEYVKSLDGPLAVAALGVDSIRGSCPHVDAWLRAIGA